MVASDEQEAPAPTIKRSETITARVLHNLLAA
jgi:hypothetical protein